MNRLIASSIVAAACALGSAASAATFDFDNMGSKPNVASLSFSDGGVSGTITPFSSTGKGSEITRGDKGLGVETLYKWVNDTDPNVDGFPGVEGLLFTFDKPVYLKTVDFRSVNACTLACGLISLEDDWTVKVNGVTVASDSEADPFDFLLDGGVDYAAWSFSVEANGLDDSWTVASFTAHPVPLPAAGWMLLAGVGGLAALRRRKEAA